MKTIVSNLSEVPEALRGEYDTLTDGRFMLKMEGDIPAVDEAHARLTEFRDNNIGLLKVKKELEDRLRIFEGIDPKEYGAMKTKITAFEQKGGVKDPTDLDAKLRQAIAEANAPLQEQLEQVQYERQEAENRLAFRDLEQKLTAVGYRIGITEKAMPDFLNRGLEVFDLDGAAKDGDSPLFSRIKPAEALSIEEWAQELGREAPHLFKSSTGGGATGGGGTAGKRTISADPLEIGRNLEALAKGEVVIAQ